MGRFVDKRTIWILRDTVRTTGSIPITPPTTTYRVTGGTRSQRWSRRIVAGRTTIERKYSARAFYVRNVKNKLDGQYRVNKRNCRLQYR